MVAPMNNSNIDQIQTLVHGHKYSSVGPARVTGDLVYEPSNIDLAMKLHYLRFVYFFDSQACEGLTTPKIKEAIFTWLNHYYESCGRFRRSDTDRRPYIKCNDCGMRFVEAKSSITLVEWLLMEDVSVRKLLVPSNVLGPELTFSPPVFLQVTNLKCGGMSLGLSWAHVLGDAFSATDFINYLGRSLKGQEPTHLPNRNKSPSQGEKATKSAISGPLSIEQVGPVGDNWTIATPLEMDTFSFHVTAKQLAQLQIKVAQCNQSPSPIKPFEALCAVIWRAVRGSADGPEPDVVTIVKRNANGPRADEMLLRNSQVVSSVEAQQPVVNLQPKELATLLIEHNSNERAQIEELVGQNPGGSDFIIYGSNLTFVDLGEADLYGLELKEFGPRHVDCFVDGIGGKGLVMVLPGPMKIGDEGKNVTLTLPKGYMEKVKEELKNEWALIV